VFIDDDGGFVAWLSSRCIRIELESCVAQLFEPHAPSVIMLDHQPPDASTWQVLDARVPQGMWHGRRREKLRLRAVIVKQDHCLLTPMSDARRRADNDPWTSEGRLAFLLCLRQAGAVAAIVSHGEMGETLNRDILVSDTYSMADIERRSLKCVGRQLSGFSASSPCH